MQPRQIHRPVSGHGSVIAGAFWPSTCLFAGPFLESSWPRTDRKGKWRRSNSVGPAYGCRECGAGFSIRRLHRDPGGMRSTMMKIADDRLGPRRPPDESRCQKNGVSSRSLSDFCNQPVSVGLGWADLWIGEPDFQLWRWRRSQCDREHRLRQSHF
jgi:hypothetical protein